MDDDIAEYSTFSYKKFDVHNIRDNYSFFHIDIKDNKLFMEGICKYILSEENLLKYATNKSGVTFEPVKQNYIKLYNELYNFIDDENLDFFEFNMDLEKDEFLLDESEEVSLEDDKVFLRLSKIGRIGEYIFHVFLSDYFKFDCIIPKAKLTTDRNMSVYGIDALFLDKTNKMILFGESKVTNKIDNGIAMVNKSLQNYEKEIREEYKLILTNNCLKLNGLEEMFPGKTELCIGFDEFIEATEINSIGVPIFIAHGKEINHQEILGKLNKGIKRKSFFNLKTTYYVISLPFINKKIFVKYITSVIRQKLEEYNVASNQG